MNVSVMTALRMVRQGIVKVREVCRDAPWAIEAEDVAAYRARNELQRPLNSRFPLRASLTFSDVEGS